MGYYKNREILSHEIDLLEREAFISHTAWEAAHQSEQLLQKLLAELASINKQLQYKHPVKKRLTKTLNKVMEQYYNIQRIIF
jgi:hypothetical protein